MKTYSKANDTAIKALELLLLLTKDEQKFNVVINEFSQETIDKYINTFNAFGLNIIKDHGKYSIMNMPAQVDMTTEDIKTFILLENLAQNINDEKSKKDCYELFGRLKKYFSIEANKFYETAKNKSKTKNISLNEITIEEEKNENDNYFHSSNTTVFECYGRLVKNYKLKDSEKIIDTNKDSIIVSNSKETKENLIHRLLRYGENCKVLKPQQFQQDFIKTVNDMIENLERNVV